jgi:predicted ATPase/transcriptional regulator with XRE-family HTH domain
MYGLVCNDIVYRLSLPALNISSAIFRWHFGGTKSVTIFAQKVIMDTFGEWLQQQRDRRRLTREEFANRVGCSVAMLRKIEYGERRPSTQIAGLIANALEIPASEHETFIRVARGELRTDRISHLSNLTQPTNTSPSQAISRSNLPVLPTPLIGRIHELKELDGLLHDPDCRLLTLVGPGGIGKTRLAIETASQLQNKFSDGVVFVPLAPVNSSRFIVPVIADSIGFAFQSENRTEPKLQLLSFLKEKQMLLLVDSIEHLLKEPDIELFSELIATAPKVKLLFTSRESLNLQAEWVFEVQGLPIPEDPQTESIIQDTSIELFIQRARRTYAGFSATAHDLPAIVRICQLVDGMPLAIELAAGWVRTLSCKEIAREIERGLDFLQTTARDLPTRHRSMRAVFNHSWKLLSEEEQSILCRLSIFRGGFKREAAEQVAGAALSNLSALVTKSLIRRNSEDRYDLHEAIRQYASSCFDKSSSQYFKTYDLHSNYYLKFVSRNEIALRSATQQDAKRVLTSELDNLREAWMWGIKRRMFELIGKAARSFGWYFEVSGQLRDGIEQFELLTQSLKDESQPHTDQWNRVFGVSLSQQALLYFRKGQLSEAQRLYEDSIEILQLTSDQSLLAEALVFLGIIMHLNGKYEQSISHLKEGLLYAKKGNDQWLMAYATYNLGHIDTLMGNYEKGREQMLSGLEIWRVLGDANYIALGLNYLVPTLTKFERYEEARASMRESIALCEQTRNRWGIGIAHRYLGTVEMAEGQYAEAEACFYKSMEVFSEYPEGWDFAMTLIYLGEVKLMTGNFDEAQTNYRDALRLAHRANAIPVALDSLLGMAQLYGYTGKLEHGLELIYCVLNHPFGTLETRERAEQLLAKLDIKTNRQKANSVRENPQFRTFDQIVAEALKTE